MKLVLKEVRDGKLGSIPLDGLSQEEYFSIVEDCHAEGYIRTPNRQIVSRHKTGGFLATSIQLTHKGHRFLDGEDGKSGGNQYFDIGSIYNSNIGSHGTVNITQGLSAAEAIEIIDRIVDAKDKEEANELVKIVSEEELKPGILKKFVGLLEKYPALVETVGKLVITQLT